MPRLFPLNFLLPTTMTLAHALPLLVVLACAQAAPPAAEPPLAKPRIEVFKAKRELQLFDGDKLIKTYRVGLGEKPVPPKEREGDMATPEGTYFICHKNPASKFHLSLAISYPGPADAERGLKAGIITKKEHAEILRANANHTTPPFYTKLGGEVFIHGRGSATDWTWGCIALDDPDIEELYKKVPVKTPITIHP
jgi:murein L,D-transpeptidase YafK